jgi:hypothetical protein
VEWDPHSYQAWASVYGVADFDNDGRDDVFFGQ